MIKNILSAFILLSSANLFANDIMISSAKESLKSKLKDPYSVVFENIFMSKGANGSDVVCGEFNAKNGYGGYVGNKKFFYIETGGDPIIEIEGSSVISGDLYDALCNTKTVN